MSMAQDIHRSASFGSSQTSGLSLTQTYAFFAWCVITGAWSLLLVCCASPRHECGASLLMNMDRSCEAYRNPSAMVTVTLSCSR
jgi:hypothetical protein